MGMITFDSPGKVFGEALPIGNGRLGAMIYGGYDLERIQLNQDSIWYGAPIDRVNPDAGGRLEEVRTLILEGRIEEAEKLLCLAFAGTPQSQRPYQTLGNIVLNYFEPAGDMQEYRRGLLLDEGIVKESYNFGMAKIKVEKTYFASYPAGILVVHLEADGGSVSFDAMLQRGRFYDRSGKMDERTIYLDGTLGVGGISFCLAMRAETREGIVRVIGEHLIVRDAKEVTLYIGCETSFYCKDFVDVLKGKLGDAIEQGYEAVKEGYKRDYRKLYGRVSFHLEGEEAEKRYAEAYFQYGRYLMISSSRPGSLPANLQGIWNEDMAPPWDSKFTININTEMNYWPAEVCNLSECHLPLFEHMRRMHKNGCRTARLMYNCRGFVAHHNTDIWGDCAPQDIYIPATFWVMGGAWLCTHIWNHYLYTRDTQFLKEMYPVLKDAVLFFQDFLIEYKGKMVTCPSVSPENTYIMADGTQGCICAGAAMDSQLLRDLFRMFVHASKLLNIHDDTVAKAERMLERIPGIQIGRYGQIVEWLEDYEEAEPGHRHISQLYALHPSHQITVDGTPELARAAAVTLERRLAHGGGHTGWSRAWIVNLYARLGKGGKALENLRELWRHSTFPNGLDSHPFGEKEVFQIDGNFGATAAIAEMLLQADENRVLLLPALPGGWSGGNVKGLVVPGGAIVDLSWTDGKLIECHIRAKNSYNGIFCYGTKKQQIYLKSGQDICLSFMECDAQ